MSSTKTGILIAGTLLLASCVTGPRPVGQLTSTEASIRAAAAGGAGEVPAATMYLEYAKEGVAHAEELMEEDDNERAAHVLMRAQADADLALVLARGAAVRAETLRVREQIEELRSKGRALTR